MFCINGYPESSAIFSRVAPQNIWKQYFSWIYTLSWSSCRPKRNKMVLAKRLKKNRNKKWSRYANLQSLWQPKSSWLICLGNLVYKTPTMAICLLLIVLLTLRFTLNTLMSPPMYNVEFCQTTLSLFVLTQWGNWVGLVNSSRHFPLQSPVSLWKEVFLMPKYRVKMTTTCTK